MTRPLHVFHEPIPAYMERLLLMGCRFAEGNTGAGTPPAEPAATPDPSKDPDPTVDEGSGANNKDEPLGEPGKKALDAERTARKAAEKRATEAEQRAAAAEAKANPAKSTTTDGEDPATGTPAAPDDTQRELWFYKALAAHPVPEEHQHLVKGNTEEEVKAAAESVSKLSSRPGVVSTSGTTGEGSPTGTSVTTGRDLYRSRHNRSRKD